MPDPHAEIKRAYPVIEDPADAPIVILQALYDIRDELVMIREALTSGGGEEFVDYRDKHVDIPANENDYEIVISPAAKVVYLTFSQDTTFKVNSPSANEIFHEASSEYEISGLRVERIYTTTGDSDTTVNIRTLLRREDIEVESSAARVQRR